MVFPIEAHTAKGDFAQSAHRVCLPHAHDIVIRVVLLQHQPHGLHIVAGIAPVAAGIEVPQVQFLGQSQLDLGYPIAYFARDEFEAPPGALVVE